MLLFFISKQLLKHSLEWEELVRLAQSAGQAIFISENRNIS